MHASKGLEWKVVILPDVNEGVVPHKKAVTDSELEEERRMFYVAMTRAKESLFLFYIKENMEEKEAGNLLPSRFLDEMFD
jgi:DNA helicase-2/ATP-dependent DNA helicase PcrA